MTEPKIALFYGDPYRCEQALAAREGEIAPDERIVRFGDELDIKALSMEMTSTSLFSSRRHFLIRHVERVRPIKTIYPLVEGSLPAGTYLTMLASDGKGLDGLIGRVKKVEGRVAGLPRPRGQALVQSVEELLREEGLQLPRTAVARLLEQGNGDLLFLREEVRKIAAYAGEETPSPTVVTTIGYTGGEESIYPFLDAFGRRNLANALAALERLYVDPNRLFPALLHHITRLTEVRILRDDGFSPRRIAAALETPEWLVRRLATQAKNYTQKELAAALSLGIELDRGIKRGGVRPADAVLKLVLAATSRPRR